MNMVLENLQTSRWNGNSPAFLSQTPEAAFEYPRDFLQNQFVYLVISPRAKGLSVGVNLNPVFKCNLHCLYCEVDRTQRPRAARLDIERMVAELAHTLALAYRGELAKRPRYALLPDELLRVRHVAVSGDGEPTLANNFVEALQGVIYVRALGRFPFFKIVLITNSMELDQSQVLRGLNT
jgi:wyosine [tRNA(Phe)-imidazoG37] synthetase (radical SAM superfamily)